MNSAPAEDRDYASAILSSFTVPVALIGTDYRYLYANAAYSRFYGISGTDLVGVTVSELIGEELFHSRIKAKLDSCMIRGRTVHFELQLPRASGGDAFLEVIYTPYRDASGTIRGAAVTSKDITDEREYRAILFRNIEERKEHEEQLAQSEEKYRALYEHAPLAYQALDTEGRLLDVNPQWLSTLGYKKEEVIGKWFGEFLHQDSIENFRINFPRFKQAGTIKGVEFSMCRGNGEIIHVSFEGCIGYDSSGNFKQSYCTFKDISAERRAQRVKQDFLANMSHELRTPLNGIMGMLSLLQNNPSIEEQGPYLDMAWESAEHLLLIIQDVLDLSRIESGSFKLNTMDFDLLHLLRHIVTLHERSAAQKGIQIVLHSRQEQCRVHADKNRISQIIVNLLSNALKYSNGGTIELNLDFSDELRFSVSDEGCGIDEARIEEIFEPFRQLEDPYTKEHGGIGAGLAIVRSLCSLMGGSIEVESEPGRGSCFTVALPLAKSVLPAEAPMDEESTRRVTPRIDGSTILIVEDEAINRLYLKRILKARGLKVLEAADGIQALESIHRERPDCVLMDIGLPRMNGIDAIQALRSDGNYRGLPVMAVTAHTHSDDRERILAAGADQIISKPYREEDILARLEELFSTEASLRE